MRKVSLIFNKNVDVGHTIVQWCSSKCSIVGSGAQDGEKPSFVAFARFWGVNNPAMANFKLHFIITKCGAGRVTW